MLSYRKELDGLRALAVIAVIIYHANLDLFGVQIFKGGFFGVDVFFVISGYLITGIIRNQMDNGRFSFRDFYWRRAKRIVPVYFFVLIVTLLGAYLLYDTTSWNEFSASLRSSLFFVSNEYFSNQDGYFSNNDREVLLHTWSLSVEWQFYLIFPIIFYITNKILPKYTFSIILATSLISFIFSYSMIFIFGNVDFAFYSLSTRWWEMSVGSLLAYSNRGVIQEKLENSNIAESIMMLSMCMLMFAMVFIDSNIPHPNFYALLVVISTGSYIVFSKEGELVTDIFSLKPIVFLGTISYGMYLWHQPIYVFFRTLKYDQMRNEQFLLLLAITISLSYLTFKLIESPFRKALNRKTTITSILLTFILIYSATYLKKESPIHYNDVSFGGHIAKHKNGSSCHSLISTGLYCHFNQGAKNTIVTLGDSHLGALLGSLKTYIDKNKNVAWIDLSSGGLYPFYVFWPEDRNDYKSYSSTSSNIINTLNGLNLDNTTILYGQYMVGQLHLSKSTGMNKSQTKEMIIDDLQDLQRRADKLILVYQTPDFPIFSKDLAMREVRKEWTPWQKENVYLNLENKINRQEFIEFAMESYEVLDSIKGENVIRIYPEEALCDKDYCYAKRKGDRIDVYDSSHASIHGAKKVFSLIQPHLP
ncbi:acyltransferase [Vibrio kyushuensis]|uniref:acyltransferase family protein n=1 Tax=Vibrio kyushuensis TaxID=2910249 RepID=UPI003D13637A